MGVIILIATSVIVVAVVFAISEQQQVGPLAIRLALGLPVMVGIIFGLHENVLALAALVLQIVAGFVPTQKYNGPTAKPPQRHLKKSTMALEQPITPLQATPEHLRQWVAALDKVAFYSTTPERLKDMGREPDLQAAEAAYQSLLRVGKPAVPYIMQAQSSVYRTRLLKHLGSDGPTAITHRDPATRAEAYRELVLPEGLPHLINALYDDSPQVQAVVMERLRAALSDPNAGARYGVLRVIRQHQPALPLLVETLADESPALRLNAIQAINTLGDVGVLPLLEPYRADPEIGEQVQATIDRLGSLAK